MKGLESILRRIKPTEASTKAERAFVGSVMSKLRTQLKGPKVVLAGSFAKGTFLEGDKDVDIFVLFGHSASKSQMENSIRRAVERAFPGVRELASFHPPTVSLPLPKEKRRKRPGAHNKQFYQVAYAQHPYVRLFLDGRKIDIVPAYHIERYGHFKARSAVDRTQLHTKYVLSHMSEAQKDDVRLLKKLLKANGLYGAEIRVQGVSGYLCELLIIRYGSLKAAMDAIADWKSRTSISFDSEGASAADRFGSPLVVIDPVDPCRNVSAVVSEENYCALVSLARVFSESKNKAALFSRRPMRSADIKKILRERHIYSICFRAPDVLDDILWGQVRRLFHTMSKAVEADGFTIIGHRLGRCGERVCILLELLAGTLPENRLVLGPPLHFREDCRKFASSYKKENLVIRSGRLDAIAKRKVRSFDEMMARIRRLPLPSHLSGARDAKLYKGAAAISNCREAAEQYFSARIR